jgi:putative two-component system response regulator
MTASVGTRARRILVIDDDDALRTVVVTHLRRRGFDVREAREAESVLLSVLVSSRDKSPYDLILADVHLPRLTGVELVRLVTLRTPLQQMVLITGDHDAALAHEALKLGVAGYLLKPFELFELDAAINPALSRMELFDATKGLALASAAADKAPVGGVLPEAWIRMANERSGAGPEHSERVARICGALTVALSRSVRDSERATLDLAAHAHEVGRLVGQASSPSLLDAHGATLGGELQDAVELNVRTAQLLTTLGFSNDAVSTIRSAREHWDGSGGPDGMLGGDIGYIAMILAVADTLDHRAVSNLAMGLHERIAVSVAVDTVIVEGGTRFDPMVVRALRETRSVIQEIWRAGIVAEMTSASADMHTDRAGAMNNAKPIRIIGHVRGGAASAQIKDEQHYTGNEAHLSGDQRHA